MPRKFSIGDHVSWNSEAGRVSGRITKMHTQDFSYKGHTRHASADDPQYEIKSDKTDHIAAHKGGILRKLPEDDSPVFTVGHSTRSLEEFLDVLRGQGIEAVVDVRKLPGSARCPQFNRESLRVALGERGVEYRRVEALTGRRPVSKTVPFETNAWWRNRSFHNYADHALGREFAGALGEMRGLVGKQRMVVMCAEAVWWRCHRRIIADHLLARGERVLHIMGEDRVVDAELSDGARIGPDGEVTYPALSE